MTTMPILRDVQRPTQDGRLPIMARRMASLAICVCLAVMVVACGGSDGARDQTVARVGGYALTSSVLAGWMDEKVDGDFFEIASANPPVGLVAEPADYPACVAALKKLTSIAEHGSPQSQPTTAQLTGKCEELYRGIKEQALEYVVTRYWLMNLLAAHGITVDQQEVKTELGRETAAGHPKDASLAQLLSTSDHTLTQEELIIKTDLLDDKLQRKGGLQALAALLKQTQGTATLANCQPGYVVEHCKGYNAAKRIAAADALAPAAILEQIAR